jgi:hypothetical protein
MLGDDKGLATAPLTAFNVGVSCGAIAVAVIARLLGRPVQGRATSSARK